MNELRTELLKTSEKKPWGIIRKSLLAAAPFAIGVSVIDKEDIDRAIQTSDTVKPVSTASLSPTSNPHPEESVLDVKPTPEAAEEIPSIELGERFEDILVTSAMKNMIPRDEVIFVDSYGAAVGESMQLTEAAGYTPQEMTVSYEGGDAVGIPGVWSDEARKQVADKYGVNPGELTMQHVYLDLKNYPELDTRLEVIRNNVETMQLVGDERNPVEYIAQEFSLEGVPSHITAALKGLMPGLVAQESRYRNVTSDKGARSYFQTLNSTQADYEERVGHKVDVNNFIAQMPVAEYQLRVSYIHLTKELADELEYGTEAYFDGNRTLMELQFLVPLIINSYNAGQGNMEEVATWFFENFTSPEQVAESLGVAEVTGYDLFIAMAHEAVAAGAVSDYKEHAGSYFVNVIGFDIAIDKFAPELFGPDGATISETLTVSNYNQSDAPPDRRG